MAAEQEYISAEEALVVPYNSPSPTGIIPKFIGEVSFENQFGCTLANQTFN